MDKRNGFVVLVVFVVVIGALFYMMLSDPAPAKSDTPRIRTDYEILLDEETGVQYLYLNGGIHPRLDTNGTLYYNK